MIEYSFVPLHDVASYLIQNMEKHHAEVEGRDGYDPLDMDVDYLLQASRLGQCFVVVPTDNQKPVGYSLFFISTSTVNKNIIEANNEALYIEKEYRGKITKDFLEKSTEFLKNAGVHRINYLIKNEAMGKLLERAGYKNEFKLWSVENE